MISGRGAGLGILTASVAFVAGTAAANAVIISQAELWPNAAKRSAFASFHQMANAKPESADGLIDRVDLVGQADADKSQDKSATERDDERPAAFSGWWWTVQEWLARANRDFQGVVVRGLSAPAKQAQQTSEVQPADSEDEASTASEFERAATPEVQNFEKEAAERKAEAERQRRAAEAEEERRRAAAARRAQRNAAQARAARQAKEREEAEKLRQAALAAAEQERQQRRQAAAARAEAERQAAEAEQQAASALQEARRLQQQEAERRQAPDSPQDNEQDFARATNTDKQETNINRRTIDLRAEPLAVGRPAPVTRPDDVNTDVAERADDRQASYSPSSYRNRVDGWRRKVRRQRANRSGYARWCRRAGRRTGIPGRYTVARGDTLWHISRRHYRRGRYYRVIYRANRQRIRNPDLIYPCQRLYLPRFRRR